MENNKKDQQKPAALSSTRRKRDRNDQYRNRDRDRDRDRDRNRGRNHNRNRHNNNNNDDRGDRRRDRDDNYNHRGRGGRGGGGRGGGRGRGQGRGYYNSQGRQGRERGRYRENYDNDNYHHSNNDTTNNNDDGYRRRGHEQQRMEEDHSHSTTTIIQQSSGSGPQRSVEGWIIFVTGLHEEAQEEDVREIFAEYGPIMNIRVNLDSLSGFCKGYGLIEYKNKSEAQDAINALHAKEFLGKTIYVDWAFVGGGSADDDGMRRAKGMNGHRR